MACCHQVMAHVSKNVGQDYVHHMSAFKTEMKGD